MELLDGYELVELTDDKIVQQRRIGETGIIRVAGNPNPNREEQQECINRVAKILFDAYQRNMTDGEEGA